MSMQTTMLIKTINAEKPLTQTGISVRNALMITLTIARILL